MSSKEKVKAHDVDNDNSKKQKKKKKSKRGLWLVLLLGFLDLGALGCLGLAYGPFHGFRDFLITTAMSTMEHKYLARMIYNEPTISKVLRENTIVEIDEATDTDAIVIGSYETQNYESKYEEQILKKDEGNDVYKIFSFKENKNTYYITVVYDPSRIKLALAKNFGRQGDTIKTIVKNNNALVGINASGFEDPKAHGDGSRATGIVIHNGKVVWRGIGNGWGKGFIGFNKEHKLVLTKTSADQAIKNGIVDAVQFGPFLIV